jgi:hypothetical protein
MRFVLQSWQLLFANSHVVIPIRSADILNRNEVLPLGQDALILGFPLGFHDTMHNLPIVRRATRLHPQHSLGSCFGATA